MRTLIALLIAGCVPVLSNAQGCCSGGSGSPIAGGASQGVLSDKQIEISTNFQYFNSNNFHAGDKDTLPLFDNYDSKYLYSKIAYGLTKDLTFSVEAGYFFNKTQIGLDNIDTFRSSGISDLLLFPRYNVFNRKDSTRSVELTLGLGYKMPIGKHNDSTLVYTNPSTGQKIYTTSPPLVQPTNGSQDFIFYAFFLRGFPKHDFRLFANAIYIKKGWNSLGMNFGDYANLGIFAGKTFFEKFSLTFQLKYEWVDKMDYDKNIDMLALYNIDVKSTGNRKITFAPQLSYTFKSFALYGLYEFPLYEYAIGVQVVTQKFFTVGLSYRFFTRKKAACDPLYGESYQCEMRCEGGGGSEPGWCKMCGMKTEKVPVPESPEKK